MSAKAPPRLLVTLWPPNYAIAKLRQMPSSLSGSQPDGPPVALIVGANEITLIAPEAVVDSLTDGVEHASREWRLVTLDAVFPLDTIGVLREISHVLADVGVPVMVLSSHDTDHFLVPGHLVGRALAALHQVRLERLLPPR